MLLLRIMNFICICDVPLTNVSNVLIALTIIFLVNFDFWILIRLIDRINLFFVSFVNDSYFNLLFV